MSLNVVSIFFQDRGFLTQTYWKYWGLKMQVNKDTERIWVLDRFCIYGQVRILCLQIGRDSFSFWKKVKQTLGNNNLLLIHSLDTLPSCQCQLYSFQFKPCIFQLHIQYFKCFALFLFKILPGFQSCMLPACSSVCALTLMNLGSLILQPTEMDFSVYTVLAKWSCWVDSAVLYYYPVRELWISMQGACILVNC